MRVKGYILKSTDVMAVKGVENISNVSKYYSKALLTVGTIAIVLWGVLGTVACLFFNLILGWLFIFNRVT